jgi:penicillin-binding protein 1A
MGEQGFLSPAQAREMATLSLPTNVSPPREESKTDALPYFTTWVKQQVVERYTPRRAFTGGLRVRTTLDLDMQKAAEETVNRWLGNPAGPTASMVAIDNDTGEVRAMVGGRNYNDAPFNLATQGQRQPGSAFKPFILATALKEGIGPGRPGSPRSRRSPTRSSAATSRSTTTRTRTPACRRSRAPPPSPTTPSTPRWASRSGCATSRGRPGAWASARRCRATAR